MNAPTRQHSLEDALADAFDPDLPDPEFAARLARLASALTDARGVAAIPPKGDAICEGDPAAHALAEDLAASDETSLRRRGGLGVKAPGREGAISLGLAIDGDRRLTALTWERMCFLRHIAAIRADRSAGTPDLFEAVNAVARGDWDQAQDLADQLRAVTGAHDIAIAGSWGRQGGAPDYRGAARTGSRGRRF